MSKAAWADMSVKIIHACYAMRKISQVVTIQYAAAH
jgi:hypothetical protein